jgi:hypothetical protein
MKGATTPSKLPTQAPTLLPDDNRTRIAAKPLYQPARINIDSGSGSDSQVSIKFTFSNLGKSEI